MESTLDTELGLWLLIWLGVTIVVVIARWRRQAGGVGLVFAYLLLLGYTHWLPALFYLSPNYSPFYDPAQVKAGFQQSLYGLLAFAVGAILLSPALRWFHELPRRRPMPRQARPAGSGSNGSTGLNARLPRLYLIIGLVSYFFVLPLSGLLPSLTAVTYSLSYLIRAGLALLCWQSWQAGDRRGVARWVVLAAAAPLITMAGQGFLGLGLEIVLIVVLFVAQTTRPPRKLMWRGLLPGLLVGYGLLSLQTTYMHNREAIRAVAWAQGSSWSQRFNLVYMTFTRFEWFDPATPTHLRPIDQREGQNVYIGRTMQRLANGDVDFAAGSTLGDAVLMLVPRALWPGKSLRSGGSALVSKYAGVVIYGSTSVGAGQVLELYLNFGTVGVVLGFVLLGGLLATLDETAARRLRGGDWPGFAVWYVAGLCLLRPGNDLANLAVGSVSGLLTIGLLNRFLLSNLHQRQVSAGRPQPPAGALRRNESE
jgi:hypothetical protein